MQVEKGTDPGREEAVCCSSDTGVCTGCVWVWTCVASSDTRPRAAYQRPAHSSSVQRFHVVAARLLNLLNVLGDGVVKDALERQQTQQQQQRL